MWNTPPQNVFFFVGSFFFFFFGNIFLPIIFLNEKNVIKGINEVAQKRDLVFCT